MAITIDIDTARPYQVHVGTFLLEQAGPLVRATAGGTKAVIVTDTNVGPLYQMPVKQSLEASGYEVSICTFEAGEAHKRAETYIAILEFVAEPGLVRRRSGPHPRPVRRHHAPHSRHPRGRLPRDHGVTHGYGEKRAR